MLRSLKNPITLTQSLEPPPMDMFPGWAKRMAEMQILAYKKHYNLDNFAIVRPAVFMGQGIILTGECNGRTFSNVPNRKRRVSLESLETVYCLELCLTTMSQME